MKSKFYGKSLFLLGVMIFLMLFVSGCSKNDPVNVGLFQITITSPNHTTFIEKTAGTFTFTATGTPRPTLTLTGTLPAGVTFNAATGVLSGTPALGTNGAYPLVFRASNGFFHPTQNFTLTVATFVAPGKYVYTNNDAITNSVSGFSINADGTLTELAGSPFATGGTGVLSGWFASNSIAMAPAKKLVFAANKGDNTITVFALNASTGALVAVGTPVASGGTLGKGGGMAVDAAENFLFVGNGGSNNISAFAIAADGTLTAVTGSPFAIPTNAIGLTLNVVGSMLYIGAGTSDQLVVMAVAANGSLTQITGSPFAFDTYSFAFLSPTLAVGAATGNNITSYSIAATGAPTLLNTLNLAESNQCVTSTPNGEFAIISGGNDPQITVINVAADGTLTQVAGSPFATTNNVSGYAVVTPSGKFLYATEYGNAIEAFSIDSSGALTSIGTYPLPVWSWPTAVIVY